MSMMISQSLLPEFDHEMGNLRKTLERVPEDKPDFVPHAKSMPLGRLAAHLAEIPMWATMTVAQDEIDINPPGGPAYQPAVMTTRKDLLAMFDQNLDKARTQLAGASDEALMRPWTLKNGGHTILTMPKIAVLRSFVMNHMIHHRAQMGVYLRMNGVPVPALYGPSADET
jgi:uncharacterized damage-inducible protein DinB